MDWTAIKEKFEPTTPALDWGEIKRKFEPIGITTLPERKVEPTPEIGAGMPSVEQPSRFTRWLAETKIPERIQAGLFGLQKAIPFSVPLAKKIYGEEPVEKVERLQRNILLQEWLVEQGVCLQDLGRWELLHNRLE